MDIDAERVPHSDDVTALDQLLFSESLSRFVLTVPPQDVKAVRALLADVPHEFIGTVQEEPRLQMRGFGQQHSAAIAELKQSWQSGLSLLS